MRYFILFYAFVLCSMTVSAQRTIQIHKVSSPISIDGVADEADWKQHRIAEHFTQTRPDNGKPSIRKTEVAILYDESYLYVLGIMHVESKAEINSQLSARDDVGNADVFAIQIDPFGETREGYDFTVTAANVQTDLKLSQNNAYENFNVVWESAVKLYETQWIAEFKIPFNSIRFPKEAMNNFKINFQRVSTKLNEESFWNPIRPEVDGFLNQFGQLTGLPKITPPLNLSFLPFVSVVNEKSPDG
ncbi:MAG: carbohydrate binding family 9 domain-containing protein, partial [Bacteroidota bacterium]